MTVESNQGQSTDFLTLEGLTLNWSQADTANAGTYTVSLKALIDGASQCTSETQSFTFTVQASCELSDDELVIYKPIVEDQTYIVDKDAQDA